MVAEKFSSNTEVEMVGAMLDGINKEWLGSAFSSPDQAAILTAIKISLKCFVLSTRTSFFVGIQWFDIYLENPIYCRSQFIDK